MVTFLASSFFDDIIEEFSIGRSGAYHILKLRRSGSPDSYLYAVLDLNGYLRKVLPSVAFFLSHLACVSSVSFVAACDAVFCDFDYGTGFFYLDCPLLPPVK